MIKGSKVVCFGEVLWDNLREGRRPGGAPLNVCYHLKKWGIDSVIISQVGADTNGVDLLKELKKLGVADDYCAVTPAKPTSTVEVIITEPNEILYQVVEDVAWDYIALTPRTEQLVSGASALVFGSLAARNAVSRRTLFQLIERSRFRVFDVNLRPPYYSEDLICSLLAMTDLLKLNEEELGIISGWLAFPGGEVEKQIGDLQARFPHIKEIILTRGALGAVYLSGGQSIVIEAYPVEISDTVGSGDAFLAGFLAGKIQGNSPEKALRQASILSSYVAGQQGACPGYEVKDLIASEAQWLPD